MHAGPLSVGREGVNPAMHASPLSVGREGVLTAKPTGFQIPEGGVRTEITGVGREVYITALD